MITHFDAILGMVVIREALKRQGVIKPRVTYSSVIKGFLTPIGNIPEEIVGSILKHDSEPLYHWLLWLPLEMRQN